MRGRQATRGEARRRRHGNSGQGSRGVGQCSAALHGINGSNSFTWASEASCRVWGCLPAKGSSARAVDAQAQAPKPSDEL